MASQLGTSAKGHQICTAHLLRELTFFEQKHESEWAKQFTRMLIRALELKKSMPVGDYEKPIKIRSDLEETLNLLLLEKINLKHAEVLTFQKRIIRFRDCLFTFHYHPDVPPDNNASERTISNIKVEQKVSGMFKSSGGAQNYATHCRYLY